MSGPFVTALRTRGPAVDLTRGEPGAFMIRAQVHEAWDAVRVQVVSATTVADVKRAGLEALLGDTSDPASYVAKVHGFEVHDESRSLADSGVRAGATVFVHSRRRRPIR